MTSAASDHNQQGPKCLSQSPEYARINKICVREAMLQLYPILKQFIDDDGAKWAKDFFDAVIEQDMQNMEIQPMTDKVDNNPFPSLEYMTNFHCSKVLSINTATSCLFSTRVTRIHKTSIVKSGRISTKRCSTSQHPPRI
jgi:hypothetical protein